jgi:hypothetical protein
MNGIIEVLEKHGFVGPEEVFRRLAVIPFSQLCRIAEDFHAALAEGKSVEDPVDLQSMYFLASSSIRGARCEGCAPKKLATLARYAALYTDRVVVPFQYQVPTSDSPDCRAALAFKLAQLMQIREVIEAGVLQVVLPEFHFCDECGKRAKKVLGEISSVSEQFAERWFDDFKFTYHRKHDHEFLEIEGPRQLLDHGSGVLFFEPPTWAPKRLKVIANGDRSKILSTSAIRKNKLLLKYVVQTFKEDLIFQQLYGHRHRMKYLTDLPGEAEFFGMSSRNEQFPSRARQLCAGLSHSVPLLRDVPLSTILRIRKHDPGSFGLYKQALGKILHDYIGGRDAISETDVETIYRDVLEPELLRLKREADAQRRLKGTRIISKAVVPAAIISLGVISGLLPQEIAQLAKIIGAVSLLSQASEAVLDKSGSDQIRNHNLYFLLRLADEQRGEVH